MPYYSKDTFVAVQTGDSRRSAISTVTGTPAYSRDSNPVKNVSVGRYASIHKVIQLC